jgi:polar amino acid transport system substrate-binding protein
MKKYATPLALTLALLLGALLTVHPCAASEKMLFLTVDKLPTGDAGGKAGDNVIRRIVNAVRAKMSDPGEMDYVPWARGLSMMSQDRPTAIFPLFRTKEREGRYQWSEPMARLRWGLFQLADTTDEIHSLAEAREKGAVIGVFRKDPRGNFFRGLGFAVEEANCAELNADKLIHGRVDLIVFSRAALAMLKQNPKFSEHEFRIAVEFEPEDMYVAFSVATDPEYVREWNAVFRRLLKDGTIRRIWENSGPQELIPPFQ